MRVLKRLKLPKLPSTTAGFEVGDKVRIISGDCRGEAGEIVRIKEEAGFSLWVKMRSGYWAGIIFTYSPEMVKKI